VIVVGAGAAGIVAATRFAEAGLETLLLERGGPTLHRDGGREIPEWSLEAYPNNTITRFDAMGYYYSNRRSTEPSYYCSNAPAQMACELGGGTAVNAEQQLWPPSRYLDDAFGFQDWTAADFQPALQRVAKRIPQTSYWSADNKHYFDEVYDIMTPVLTSIGMKEVDTTTAVDSKYNTFGRQIHAASEGFRGGPLVGYLQDAKKLPNFTLRLGDAVEHVVHSPDDPARMIGVSVKGNTITAPTVVLSAGVWNTVSLLFTSGVGPAAELRTASDGDITPYTSPSSWIVNDAVGQELHDNPPTSVGMAWHKPDELPAFDPSGLFTGRNINKEYADMLFHNRSGPYTGTGRQLVGWLPATDPKNSSLEMVIQIICSTPSFNGSIGCQFNLNEGALSRASITLDRSGRLAFGGSDGGPWLTDPRDLRVYAVALKTFLEGVSKYPGISVTKPRIPSGSPLEDYEDWLQVNAAHSNNHWGGGCVLGSCTDLDTRVRGTQNLFVVDGSLTPAPTTSNPAFLYEGVAEMAADKILKLLGGGNQVRQSRRWLASVV